VYWFSMFFVSSIFSLRGFEGSLKVCINWFTASSTSFKV